MAAPLAVAGTAAAAAVCADSRTAAAGPVAAEAVTADGAASEVLVVSEVPEVRNMAYPPMPATATTASTTNAQGTPLLGAEGGGGFTACAGDDPRGRFFLESIAKFYHSHESNYSCGATFGPRAKVIRPSKTTFPPARAIPCNWPIRLRSRCTVTSMVTTSPGWAGRRKRTRSIRIR